MSMTYKSRTEPHAWHSLRFMLMFGASSRVGRRGCEDRAFIMTERLLAGLA